MCIRQGVQRTLALALALAFGGSTLSNVDVRRIVSPVYVARDAHRHQRSVSSWSPFGNFVQRSSKSERGRMEFVNLNVNLEITPS